MKCWCVVFVAVSDTLSTTPIEDGLPLFFVLMSVAQPTLDVVPLSNLTLALSTFVLLVRFS